MSISISSKLMDSLEERYLDYMYRRMGCFPMVLLLAMLAFMGCKTIKDSELVEIHDTVSVNRIDTVYQYTQKIVNDTVREKTEHIVTVNEKGDTIRETNNYYYNQHTIERDSSAYYAHLIDSIMKSLNQNHDHEKVVEKKPSIWERFKWQLIALALLIALILLLVPRIKKFLTQRKTIDSV